MATYNLNGVSPDSFIAGGSISQYRLVKLDSAANTVIATTAIADLAVGASLESASTGGLVPVQRFGKAKLTASAPILKNAQVMATASGAGKISTSSGGTAVSVGVALEAAGADGDVIEVMLGGLPTVAGPANS